MGLGQRPPDRFTHLEPFAPHQSHRRSKCIIFCSNSLQLLLIKETISSSWNVACRRCGDTANNLWLWPLTTRRSEALVKIAGVMPAFMRPRKSFSCNIYLSRLLLKPRFSSLWGIQWPRAWGSRYPWPDPRKLGLRVCPPFSPLNVIDDVA